MLQTICNYIILFGTISVAIFNIIKLFKEPANFLKSKRRKEIEEIIANEFKKNEELLTDYIQQEIYKDMNKLIANKDELEEIITEQVLNKVLEGLQEIRAINEKQSEKINIIEKSSRDILRQRITMIYDMYKSQRKLPLKVKEELDELFNDYTAEDGNGYIRKLYKRMQLWEIDKEEDL